MPGGHPMEPGAVFELGAKGVAGHMVDDCSCDLFCVDGGIGQNDAGTFFFGDGVWTQRLISWNYGMDDAWRATQGAVPW